MNSDQQKVFYHIRNWCLEKIQGKNPQPFYIHVTGGAGTGKSHLVKCLYYEITKILRNRDSPDDTKVLLTAPTGTAAFGVGGFTIHSALKIPRKLKIPYEALGNETLNTLQSQLGDLQILIIDEISMVDRKLLAYIHGRLKQIKQCRNTDRNAWFGKTSILAIGDFYQLPPVRARALCIPNRKDGIDLWHDNFQIVSLNKIMRQKDDVTFAETLNRIREKKISETLSEQDDATLSSRNNLPNVPDHALRIFAKNVDVDRHNALMLARCCRNPRTLIAQDYIKEVHNNKFRKSPHTLKGKSDDLPDVLHIDVGARVMLTRNIDTSDGLVNGAFGTVVGIDELPKPNEVSHVYVLFDNKKVGKKQKSHGVPGIPVEAVAIKPFEEMMASQFTGRRRQMPLKLAFSCTIHKVQGMSTNQCVFDMEGVFEAGQSYVALSRVTSLSGLFLLNYNPSLIYCHKEIQKSLMSMTQLETKCLPPEVAADMIMSTCVHHNVQGLKSKMDDIRMNEKICGRDIIMITESWLTDTISDTDVQLENYNILRNDRLNNNGRGGVAVYLSQQLLYQKLDVHIPIQLEQISMVIQKGENIPCVYITIYRPPAQDVNTFVKVLRELLKNIDSSVYADKSIMIAGDFNEDLLAKSPQRIKEVFELHGYTQTVRDSTTRYGSLLDAVYIRTNIQIITYVTPTYYSDHEAVQIMLTTSGYMK
jgi:exonuclease III